MLEEEHVQIIIIILQVPGFLQEGTKSTFEKVEQNLFFTVFYEELFGNGIFN